MPHRMSGLVPDLAADEKVELILRRHWIVFVKIGFELLFLVISTIIIAMSAPTLSSVLPPALTYVLLIIYICVFLEFIYIQWINDELDLFVVTNKRIIGIEQISFLNRRISECSHGVVQEVNSQTQGVLGNLFRFGQINVHSASERSDFVMSVVPDAFENSRRIHTVVDSYKDLFKEEQL